MIKSLTSQAVQSSFFNLNDQLMAFSSYLFSLSNSINGTRRIRELNEVVKMYVNGMEFYKAQETMADEYLVERETINKDWKEFKENNLLYVRKRGRYRTQISYLSSLFFISKFNKILRRYFPDAKHLLTELSTRNVTSTIDYSSSNYKYNKEGSKEPIYGYEKKNEPTNSEIIGFRKFLYATTCKLPPKIEENCV